MRPDQPQNAEKRDNVIRLPGAANDPVAAEPPAAERWKDLAAPDSAVSAGIEAVILDTHTSILEGSAGAIPRRLMVHENDEQRARAVLKEIEEAA